MPLISVCALLSLSVVGDVRPTPNAELLQHRHLHHMFLRGQCGLLPQRAQSLGPRAARLPTRHALHARGHPVRPPPSTAQPLRQHGARPEGQETRTESRSSRLPRVLCSYRKRPRSRFPAKCDVRHAASEEEETLVQFQTNFREALSGGVLMFG